MARVFAHAVASFEPTADSVLLWTRLSGSERAADWVIASDPGLTDVVASGREETSEKRDFTITVEAGGLEPETLYWYRFRAGGEDSPVGRTRTLPAGPTDAFRVATVSCARYSVAPLGVYRALAEREVDLVLHLGDYIYEDDGAKGARSHEPPHDAVTLDDYRKRLGQMRSDPDTQALHLRHPVVTIWDDHDLADNAWSHGAKHHDPERQGPWADRLRAAVTARQEWLPARLPDPDDALRTWRSLNIGDLAELVLMDTRVAGRDRHAGDDGARPLLDPNRSMLGAEQRQWVRDRLRDTERRWVILASSVVMNDLQLPWPKLLQSIDRMLPNGFAASNGCLIRDDQWDGYPAERERITGWMHERGERGGRTVILSGDVHASWAVEGPCAPGGKPVAIEFTTPAVSSAAMGRAPTVGLLLDRAVEQLPHVKWADVTQRGYCLVDFTPDDVTTSWWFADPYDPDPAANVCFGAAYRVAHEAWPPALERAEVAPDAERPGLPQPLPARPDDLVRLRMRKRMRTTTKAMSAVGGVAASVAAVLLRRHRSSSRRPLLFAG